MVRKVRKLAELLANSRYRRGLRYHVAAATEHTPFLGHQEWATVVDIGANVGQFALAVRANVPNAKIIAFEPLAQAASTFRQLFAGDGNVSLHVIAIGPRSEHAVMNVSKRADSSSLLPIGETQVRVFPRTGLKSRERVRVERLSSLVDPHSIRAPALVKLDVQGFELAALEGCSDCLDRFDDVYVECSFVELYQGQSLAHEVVAFLRDRGFAVHGVYNMTYDRSGRSVQADFHFRRLQSTDDQRAKISSE